jgi:hypothetical protein
LMMSLFVLSETKISPKLYTPRVPGDTSTVKGCACPTGVP